MGVDEGDFALTMVHVDQALDAYHNPDTLAWAIDVLNSAGRSDISWELLYEAKNSDPPQNPIAAFRWRHALVRIERGLLSFEGHGKKRTPATQQENAP